MEAMDLAELWRGLGWPLIRLLFFVSLGILVGNFIEALNWTRQMARLARPLIRLGRLSDITGASFALAFFSGVASNAMLAEAFDQGRLGKRELVLANLFNSLPRFFLHLPTVFFLTAPLIGRAALHYVGVTLAAALLQTGAVVVLGRLLLPAAKAAAVEAESASPAPAAEAVGVSQALARAWRRFQRRVGRLFRYTVPIYTLFFLLQRAGVFQRMEDFLAAHLSWLAWLKPQAMGIVALHVGAEFAAGLAAAGALLDQASLGVRDVVLALLVGNVLSTPMRAVRHQLPYYAGIYPSGLAVELIVYSQAFRVAAVLAAGVVYLVASG